MPDPALSIVPFACARTYGPGTPDACRSRSGQIVARVLCLIRDRADFRFLLDGPGMVEGYLADRPHAGSGLEEALAEGRLAVGGSWTTVGGWPMVGEELVRNLQLAARWHESRETKDVGLLVQRAGLSLQLPQLAAQLGLPVRAYVVDDVQAGIYRGLDGQKLVTVPLAGTVDLEGLDGTKPAVGRDTEKVLTGLLAGERSPVVPWGGMLSQPSDDVLDALEEWAASESVSVLFSGPEILSGGEAEWTPGAPSGWDEALHPDVVPPALACARGLLRSERAAALLAAATGSEGDETSLARAWQSLLYLRDGTLTGSGDAEKRVRIGEELGHIAEIARGIQERAERQIGLAVSAGEGPAGTLPIVVFNHTGFARTEPVDAHVTFYGEGSPLRFERYEQYWIVDAAGNPVSVEETGGKQVDTAELSVRFLAEHVPAFGYRTYYLVPRPVDLEPAMSIQAPGAMAPYFPEPTFALEDVEDTISKPFRGIRVGRTFTTGRYVVVLDEVTGRIEIRERGTGRTLVDGLHVAAFEVDLKSGSEEAAETGRVFEFALDRAELVSSGEVSATLLVKGHVLSSPCEVELTLYSDLDRVGLALKLAWRDQKPARVCLVFPQGTEHRDIRYGVPFGAVDLGREMGTRQCAGWVQMRGASGGWVLASERQTFTFTGDAVRSEVLYSTVDPASYAYNRVWRRYPDEIQCRYTLRYFDLSSGASNPWQDSECLAHPMSACVVYDRDSPRALPSDYSTASLEGEGLVVTALLPGERPGDLVLRGYESQGESTIGRICSDGRVVRVQSGDLAGNTWVDVDRDAVRFAPFEIKQFRISLEEDPPTGNP